MILPTLNPSLRSGSGWAPAGPSALRQDDNVFLVILFLKCESPPGIGGLFVLYIQCINSGCISMPTWR